MSAFGGRRVTGFALLRASHRFAPFTRLTQERIDAARYPTLLKPIFCRMFVSVILVEYGCGRHVLQLDNRETLFCLRSNLNVFLNVAQ